MGNRTWNTHTPLTLMNHFHQKCQVCVRQAGIQLENLLLASLFYSNAHITTSRRERGCPSKSERAASVFRGEELCALCFQPGSLSHSATWAFGQASPMAESPLADRCSQQNGTQFALGNCHCHMKTDTVVCKQEGQEGKTPST